MAGLAVGGGEGVEGLQHLFGAGADAKIFGEIEPADFSGGIDEKFGGAGDVGAVFAAVGMNEIPAADDVVFGVGENREGVASGLAEMLGLLRGVHANGDDSNPASVEVWQMFLEAPQLGVAEGSPVAAIEDQDDGSSFGGGRACGGLGVRCEGGI